MPEGINEYEVGYGRPPKSGQFVKGASGNPKGRPKNSKNLATTVLRESRQLVRINGPHGTRAVTKLQAAVMQISNKSAQGDLRASREFFTLLQRSEESGQWDRAAKASRKPTSAQCRTCFGAWPQYSRPTKHLRRMGNEHYGTDESRTSDDPAQRFFHLHRARVL